MSSGTQVVEHKKEKEGKEVHLIVEQAKENEPEVKGINLISLGNIPVIVNEECEVIPDLCKTIAKIVYENKIETGIFRDNCLNEGEDKIYSLVVKRDQNNLVITVRDEKSSILMNLNSFYGKLHGEFLYKDEDICIQTSYSNNTLHGNYRSVENGKLHICRFYYGLRHGKRQEYFDMTNLKLETEFNMGKKDGEEILYSKVGMFGYSYKNQVRRYKNGILHGECISYNNVGRIIHRITYNNGKKEGKEKLCDEHNIELASRNWKNGIKDGEEIIRESKQDGVYSIKNTSWVNGKIEGLLTITKYSFQNMEFEKEIWEYKNDKKNGKYTKTMVSKVIFEANYENDLLQGKYFDYSKDDKNPKITYYHEGKKNGLEVEIINNGITYIWYSEDKLVYTYKEVITESKTIKTHMEEDFEEVKSYDWDNKLIEHTIKLRSSTVEKNKNN